MTRFSLSFAHPLLLLAFAVGAGLTFLLYFTLSKKYRKTRNRITSMVLHLVVFALATLTLAGTLFVFTKPNTENKILLVVDVSDSEESVQKARDEFVESVVDGASYDGFRLGIVTFGFDQVYAVPLTDDMSSVLFDYYAAEEPDKSATDIAAALRYAADLFDSTESAKIVLVTDGKETDESALSVIRTISAKGIKVDVARIASSYPEADVRITGVTLPDYHVSLGENCALSATLAAGDIRNVSLALYDNDVLVEDRTVDVVSGAQDIGFTHNFTSYGLHRISFRITAADDVPAQNNVYESFLFLEQFNNVLILEQKAGESANLQALLAESPEDYKVTTLNVHNVEELPATLGALRKFDQVILNNIAYADLPEGYDELLYTYVNDCGGGLFTVAGSDDSGEAHSFNREDMLFTTYQSMLPVEAVNYTPPLAVIVIVDRSGSMSTDGEIAGSTKYELALNGAHSCLNSLTERDYFGLMTLDSDYEMILPLTPRSQEAKINAAINYAANLSTDGGTVFPGAIQRACQALRSADVAKRHIIIVTDGQVPSEQAAEYEGYIKYYHDTDGITVSVVGIGVLPGSEEETKMKHACEDLGGGVFYAITDPLQTVAQMREDLNAPEIKEVNMETFAPAVKGSMSAAFNGVTLTGDATHMTVTIGGFYGTKAKADATVLLTGDYDVPIYAQRRLGKGSVGSFLCDLTGTWSSDFLNLSGSNDGSGRKFLLNVISGLMPVENIREQEITVNLERENYINRASVYADLDEGEKIVATITDTATANAPSLSLGEITVPEEGTLLSELGAYVITALDATNNYSRCDFVLKESGVYLLRFEKQKEDGTVLAATEFYVPFSYSEEYVHDDEETETVVASLIDNLTELTGGVLIEDNENPYEVFANFVTHIVTTFDPRYLFMILTIVLFLLDVAVRKFKFKWPHEIVRAIREKKNGKGGTNA